MKFKKRSFFAGWNLLFGVALVASLGFYSSVVRAKTIGVKSGTPTVIALIGHVNGENCTSHLPRSKVTGTAQNGQISVKWSKHSIRSGHCEGARIDVIVVTYRSKRGFRGTDKVRVRYRAPRRRFAQSETAVVRTRKYTVEVK